MGFQQKLAISVSNYQRKVSDMHIDHLGTEQSLIRLTIDEDKYGDRDYVITANEKITGILIFPGGEIPITFGETNTTTTQNNVHLYDILPIELYVKNTTELKHGDIILQKIRTNANLPVSNPDAFRLISLQVVDTNIKFTVERVWTKYIVAPYTLNITADGMGGLQTIINSYLAEDWI